MTQKRHKGVLAALIGIKQETLDSWMHKLDVAIGIKTEARKDYEGIASRILPLLNKARQNDISFRELAEITGISYQTLHRWAKMLDDGAHGQQETQNMATQ